MPLSGLLEKGLVRPGVDLNCCAPLLNGKANRKSFAALLPGGFRRLGGGLLSFQVPSH